MKKSSIIIPLIIWATLLPLKWVSQAKENIRNKAQSELVENNIQREIPNKLWKKILIKESHEEVVNMNIKTLQEKYKENTEIIYNYHMFQEINNRRKALWIQPLSYDETLEKICKEFSKYLAQKEKIWHIVDWKTSKDMWISTRKYKIIRENIAMDNIKYSTIFEMIDIWQYMDDENDKIRWEKRDLDLNHKTPMLSKDVDKLWCYFTISWEILYIVINSGKLFSN